MGYRNLGIWGRRKRKRQSLTRDVSKNRNLYGSIEIPKALDFLEKVRSMQPRIRKP